MKPRIEIQWGLWGLTKKGARIYWWRLKAGNGEILFQSEMFTTRSNTRRAAKRAKELMAIAEIE